jgi:hypothetical protein
MIQLSPEMETTLKGLSVPRAYDLLVALGHANVFVYLRGMLVFVKDFITSDEISWQMAVQTPLMTFWGGPPNKLQYYDGTLYTLLVDRIYDYLQTHTMEEVCKIVGIQKTN